LIPSLRFALFANQNYLTAGFPLPILPFNLAIGAISNNGYAEQGNLTVEREIAGSWKFRPRLSIHPRPALASPVDINSTNPQLIASNDANAVATDSLPPATVLLP